MDKTQLATAIEAVRKFSRFYTSKIGTLSDIPYPLAEARVIYELSTLGSTTATELGEIVGLDAGYLSRILKKQQDAKLIEKKTSDQDARKSILTLTSKGRSEFATLDRASRSRLAMVLKDLAPSDLQRILQSMTTIENLLGENELKDRQYILRDPRPGDYGWIIESNGRLYAEQYNWNSSYEALVAEIVAKFVQTFDASRERCWIAERDGQNVGSVFLVKKSATVAKLRMLIVEPRARGLGIGKRLVEECTRFARQSGYKKITLWTQSILTAARRIYKSVGYELVASEPNHLFGHELVSETWELKL